MGAAIYNLGGITVTSSSLIGNSSGNYGGGAIYNESSGDLTLIGSTIAGNSTIYYGGAGFQRRCLAFD